MAIELTAAEHADFSEGELYFVGNATTILRYAGFAILTDPAFLHAGEHVHLGHGIYARREVEPACQISELPPLDLVVLSHHHGDHFDDVAARELDKNLPIITNEHAVRLLRQQGFTRGHALDTWESQEVLKGDAQLRVTSMPGKHAPDHVAGLLPPVMGSILDFIVGEERCFRLYISGDTLLHDRLYDIPRWSVRSREITNCDRISLRLPRRYLSLSSKQMRYGYLLAVPTNHPAVPPQSLSLRACLETVRLVS